MTDTIILKGITWNHSRGLVPVVATAQRFSELNPGIEIIWEKRSLQQFADFSIEELAQRYDLLVIDHPWAGFAARTKSILPLNQYLSAEYMEDQKSMSVGRSFESYSFGGDQWALPIDAATPVASSRPDLFKKYDLTLPQTFDDLLKLADMGLVGFAGIPIDVLMSFYMFCCSLGEEPCATEEYVVSDTVGKEALRLFKELAVRISPECFDRNPIKIYETMTLTDEIAYCPFAYGYSNYSRKGYAAHLLHFHDLVKLSGESPMRSTLGGTGLAVSSSSEYRDAALKYAEFCGSPDVQRTIYSDNGGQPGHLSAWTDAGLNERCENYFQATLPALERAFLRPRYHGHMYFQDHAGDVVRDYLMGEGDEDNVLNRLNELYTESKNIV